MTFFSILLTVVLVAFLGTQHEIVVGIISFMKQVFTFNSKITKIVMIKGIWLSMILVLGMLYLMTDDGAFAWLMSLFVLAMFIGTNKKEQKPLSPPDNWWEDVHVMD